MTKCLIKMRECDFVFITSKVPNPVHRVVCFSAYSRAGIRTNSCGTSSFRLRDQNRHIRASDTSAPANEPEFGTCLLADNQRDWNNKNKQYGNNTKNQLGTYWISNKDKRHIKIYKTIILEKLTKQNRFRISERREAQTQGSDSVLLVNYQVFRHGHMFSCGIFFHCRMKC